MRALIRPGAPAPRVMLDACVLYPTVMREMLFAVAETGAFRPLWTDRLAEEWRRAVARLGPVQAAQAESEIAAADMRFPAARVAAGVDARYWLPDPADVHVLAAAVAASCEAIVTLNAKDFPRNLLAQEGLARVDPDTLLMEALAADPDGVGAAAERVLGEARRLSDGDWEMRPLLRKARLPKLGKALGTG